MIRLDRDGMAVNAAFFLTSGDDTQAAAAPQRELVNLRILPPRYEPSFPS